MLLTLSQVRKIAEVFDGEEAVALSERTIEPDPPGTVYVTGRTPEGSAATTVAVDPQGNGERIY